jgi:AcrR family transcriptional regulator
MHMGGPVSTEDRILNAAEHLFASQGYAGTPTRALAERAGVNEVTLFRRFGSKAGVLRALGARVAEQTAGLTSVELPDDEELAVAVTRLVQAEVVAARRFGALTVRLAIESASHPEVAQALAAGTGTNRASVAGFVRARQQRGQLRADLPAELLAETFFAMTSGLVLGRQLVSPADGAADADDAALVAAMTSLFLSGAAQPTQPSGSRRTT